GNPDADLMFVGEAPGGDEDIQGIPFVGRAGQLLTKMIAAINLERDQVYIANVIKCRPPGNRNPEPDEVDTCEPFLFQQIDAVRPRVIVALGSFAAKALLRSNDSISRLRGRVYEFRGAKLIPTFHPAFLLRSPERKRDAWEERKSARARRTAPVTDEEEHPGGHASCCRGRSGARTRLAHLQRSARPPRSPRRRPRPGAARQAPGDGCRAAGARGPTTDGRRE